MGRLRASGDFPKNIWYLSMASQGFKSKRIHDRLQRSNHVGMVGGIGATSVEGIEAVSVDSVEADTVGGIGAVFVGGIEADTVGGVEVGTGSL